MNSMYERIDRLCRDHGILQAEMCRDCGFAQPRISDLKKNPGRTLSKANTEKVAKYFGVSVDWLLHGEEEGVIKIDAKKGVETRTLVKRLTDAQLLAMITACTEEMKRRRAACPDTESADDGEAEQ